MTDTRRRLRASQLEVTRTPVARARLCLRSGAELKLFRLPFSSRRATFPNRGAYSALSAAAERSPMTGPSCSGRSPCQELSPLAGSRMGKKETNDEVLVEAVDTTARSDDMDGASASPASFASSLWHRGRPGPFCASRAGYMCPLRVASLLRALCAARCPWGRAVLFPHFEVLAPHTPSCCTIPHRRARDR